MNPRAAMIAVLIGWATTTTGAYLLAGAWSLVIAGAILMLAGLLLDVAGPNKPVGRP